MKRRAAFTLSELLVVGVLTTVLALLLAQTWAAVVRPTIDLAAGARLSQEAGLASAALARDLGGSLANPEGRLGPATLYPLVGRLQPNGTALWLCFDGGSAPNGTADWAVPDAVIAYALDGDRLVRTDQNAGTSVTVARHLSDFQAEDAGGAVRLRLTFAYRGQTRTYTLVAQDP